MVTLWTHSPGVRLRPVPEQAICLAYVPRPPALHGLNLTSWLVCTLCDGRDEAAIAADYFSAVAPSGGPAATPAALEAALMQLEALGLIRRSAGKATEEL
jgi:hypothetical protein